MEHRNLLVSLLAVCLLVGPIPCAFGCDCNERKDAGQPLGNDIRPLKPANDRGRSTSTLDDVLTPELVQSYLALQLHRAALDMVDKANNRPVCSQSPCSSNAGGAFLRRAKRFAANPRADTDVPIVLGLSALTGAPTRSPLFVPRPMVSNKDDSNDVPVFKGTHEGSPLVRVVTPPPTPSLALARRTGFTTTVPTVPVVKGTPDPAHPATPKTSSLLPGDLQLTPEEEEALAVLLEGRHQKTPTAPRPRPALRPNGAPRPAMVSSVSGKVGSKAAPSGMPAHGIQQNHRSSSSSSGSSRSDIGVNSSSNGNDCCSQKRLLHELERQLAILRQLNADHLREEWVRASYPSPYYPYLHNLPVHPARGYDAPPSLLADHFFPSSDSPGWRRWPNNDSARRPTGVQQRSVDASDCDWSGPSESSSEDGVEDGGYLDDKVRFSEQQREVDDLRGADPHDDVGIDHKIGDPVDFEIR